MASVVQVRQFAVFAAVSQIVFIILFAIFADYSPNAYPSIPKEKSKPNGNETHEDDGTSEFGNKLELDHYYPSTVT